MAQLAVELAHSDDVRSLTERILTGNGTQLQTMTRCLAEWEDDDPATASDLDHGGLGDEDDLDHRGLIVRLEAATDPGVRPRFLQLMSVRQEAITIVKEHRAAEQMPGTLAFTDQTVRKQDREIAHTERLAAQQ